MKAIDAVLPHTQSDREVPPTHGLIGWFDSPSFAGNGAAREHDVSEEPQGAECPDEETPRRSSPVDSRERHGASIHAALEEPTRGPADGRIPQARAKPSGKMGELADDAPDTMTLHTTDAYRIFTGRAADAEGGISSIPGGRRFAAILKSIWHLSANDNPYADWILIRMYADLLAIRKHLSQVITAYEEEIERLKRKGLTISVMGSRSPKTVALGFRSPYGYATAQAIVEFDYHVRMVKTLVRKDRMSDREGWGAIHEIGRKLRALFLEPIRWERYLLREELRQLSRSDFLPGAEEAARQRVRAAVALFGQVPREVFTGAEVPRHSRRRMRLTESELRLLTQASLLPTEGPAQSDAELL